MVPLRGNGIRSTICAVASVFTESRGAPLGSPVVPLVRMTDPPALVGGGSGSVEFAATMSSRVCAPAGTSAPSSTQISTRGRSAGSASSRPRNSLSCSITLTFSRSQTSANCGFAKPGVHQHHPGAELAACGHRDGEAAVVAAQHTDDRAGGDTEVLQPVRQRPRLVIDLLVGQRPAFVDDRRQGRIPAPAHGSPSSPAVRRRARAWRPEPSSADPSDR